MLFDYTEAPPTEPEGWPRFTPNDRGLSMPVYGNMKDYCRRVAQSAYFSLTRPEWHRAADRIDHIIDDGSQPTSTNDECVERRHFDNHTNHLDTGLRA